MKRITPKLFLFIAILSLNLIDSFGCTCILTLKRMSLKQQINEARKKSTAVFMGQVLEITTDPNMPKTVKFQVHRSWKLVQTKEVFIMTGYGGGDCGFHFTVGVSYLVYAYGVDINKLSTNICQRTANLKKVTEDVKILGTGKVPR
jgi:hypothetical protein